MIHESNFKVQSKEGAEAKGMFLRSNNSNKKLIVTFPGIGYTCDMPVLYYFREVALQHKCDILSIQYYFCSNCGMIISHVMKWRFNLDLLLEKAD